jgi:error-prone DNA polymerase
VAHDYGAVGLSLRAHPVSFLRNRLRDMGATVNADLADERRSPAGRTIAVAGITLVRQRPSTANGIIFMTLEDETGIANLILRPEVYKRCRQAARHGTIVLARGTVERQGAVVHVLVKHIENVQLENVELETVSRDFH